MTLNYGWIWLDRDITAKKVQIAVESPLEYDNERGDDPTVENFLGDTRLGYDLGTQIRVWRVKDAVFKTQADFEAFMVKVQNTTGTMRLEYQVASAVTSTNMLKFDGSNTTYEVFYDGHKGARRAGPGSNTVFKVRTINLIQGA